MIVVHTPIKNDHARNPMDACHEPGPVHTYRSNILNTSEKLYLQDLMTANSGDERVHRSHFA